MNVEMLLPVISRIREEELISKLACGMLVTSRWLGRTSTIAFHRVSLDTIEGPITTSTDRFALL
jgi:hypothetical protein